MSVPDMPDGPTLLDDWRAGLAELISTLIFVFAGEGAGMAFNKLNIDSSTTPPASSPPPLPTPSLCSLQSPSVQEYPAATSTPPSPSELSSEAHHLISRHRLLDRSASRLDRACLLLKFVTGGLSTPTFALSAGVGVWNAVLFEIVMTFGLVYTVYATAVDRKKGDVGVMAPIAIGFVVGANILAGGAFDGASMNPAISFGPALVSWSWENHWVYWVGPLIGGGLAGLLYELESEICISF